MSLFGLLPQTASQVPVDAGMSYGIGAPSMSMTQQGGNPNLGAPDNMGFPDMGFPQEQGGYQADPIGLLGMLGVKGKARDILGTLGDAFLVQGGNKPMYAPAKRQNQINEAMYGFGNNPMEAMKKLYAIDPTMARKVESDYLKQQQEAQQAQIDMDGSRLDNTETEYDVRKKVVDSVAGLMHGANEATYEAMRQRAVDLGKRYGVNDIEQYLPKVYDAEAIANFGNMAMGPKDVRDDERDEYYKNNRLEDYDRAEDRQSRNTDSMMRDREERRVETRRSNRVQDADRTRRTNIQEYKARNPSSETKKSKSAPTKVSGTLPLSRIPASARTGTKDGRKVALVNGKLYYIGN